jgi:hypothetical protein
MPFLDRNEPYIVDISHGLVVIFKPSGWHATLHEPGDVSVPSWLFEHYDLLPASALKEAVQANALRIGPLSTIDRNRIDFKMNWACSIVSTETRPASSSVPWRDRLWTPCKRLRMAWL